MSTTITYAPSRHGWTKQTVTKFPNGSTGYSLRLCSVNSQRLINQGAISVGYRVDWFHRLLIWFSACGWRRPLIWYRNLED